MQIVEKKVTELKAYEKNPRKNDKAVDPVAESIKEFGFKVPIIIDKDNVIVAGHTRLRAAKKLGMKTVPCIVADDLTPDQIKAFRLADNKVSEFAEWDIDLLTSELKEIDFDMELFGFLGEEYSEMPTAKEYQAKEYQYEHFLVSFCKDEIEKIEEFKAMLDEKGYDYEQSHN
jgi:ParB family chromosome partitioning protein